MKNALQVLLIMLTFFNALFSNAQVTPFKKSVLDSLKTKELNTSISFTINASKDVGASLATSSEMGMLYVNSKDYFEFKLSSYMNRYESFSASNRFFAMIQAGINSHTTDSNQHIKPKQLYFEPFLLLNYDLSRAINYRIQGGTNLVYALKPNKLLLLKFGVGLLYEAENWQMITHDQISEVENYPDPIKKLIFDTLKIRSDGSLLNNNFRMNFYANFISELSKTINLNGFISLQQPFLAPYRNLSQIPQFPRVTGLYPRISAELELSVNIWKKLSLLSIYSLQFDKGQLPQYVPNFVYNFSQGFAIAF